MKTERIEKIDDHEALLDAWAQRFASDDAARCFARDGIIAPATYAAPRLLFILKDPSDGKHAGDLRAWTRQTGEAGQISPKYGTTWFNIARWAQALLDDPGAPIDQARDQRAAVRATLQRIAVINLKKNAFNPKGTNGTADESLVYAFACRDQHFLRRQIELIKPDVIVGCGVTNPLVWLLGLEEDAVRLAKEALAGKTARSCVDEARGCPVLLMPHPGARRRAAAMVNDLEDVWRAAQSH